MGIKTTIFLNILFELLEKEAKKNVPKIFPNPTPDTVQNIIGDLVSAMSGW